ncbi:MAG: 5'/3'-nucleotidase SurE [Anaerolineales bacterium]
MKEPQILLTNDDGIHSPGLWAAAEALSSLGYVHVVAPRLQYSGAGRSLPSTSDGVIQAHELLIHGQKWIVYAVNGSPAQAVLHGVLEISPVRPQLVVSGINYGENVGPGVTISGTVGAALEAASLGIPALAASLETAQKHHLSYSREVDFSTAAHFTTLFARRLLGRRFFGDVSVIKVDVPSDATPETPWVVTRVARERYYEPVPPKRTSWDQPAVVGYRRREGAAYEPDSDAYALAVERVVSVSPLSLDLTARVDFDVLQRWLDGGSADS